MIKNTTKPFIQLWKIGIFLSTTLLISSCNRLNPTVSMQQRMNKAKKISNLDGNSKKSSPVSWSKWMGQCLQEGQQKMRWIAGGLVFVYCQGMVGAEELENDLFSTIEFEGKELVLSTDISKFSQHALRGLMMEARKGGNESIWTKCPDIMTIYFQTLNLEDDEHATFTWMDEYYPVPSYTSLMVNRNSLIPKDVSFILNREIICHPTYSSFNKHAYPTLLAAEYDSPHLFPVSICKWLEITGNSKCSPSLLLSPVLGVLDGLNNILDKRLFGVSIYYFRLFQAIYIC